MIVTWRGYIMGDIHQDMLLGLVGERILHYTRMPGTRELHRDAVLEFRGIVPYTRPVVSYAALPVRRVVQYVDRVLEGGERHLRNEAVLRRAPSAVLMHHADPCYKPFRCPSPIKLGEGHILLPRVDAHLNHTERQGAADEDVAAPDLEGPILAVISGIGGRGSRAELTG